MPPKESDPLFVTQASRLSKLDASSSTSSNHNKVHTAWWMAIGCCSLIVGIWYTTLPAAATTSKQKSGPYKLAEAHVGDEFLQYYTFYKGDDSLGSAGFQRYVDGETAVKEQLVQVDPDTHHVRLNSLAGDHADARRRSVRLEGNTRWNSGLFLLQVHHIPAGCGQWPAFWLTDEDQWPLHGEIDILEGVNYQSHAKTALHTSPDCSMYAHVPDYAYTGHWDRATGLPDTFTGIPDYTTNLPADNCWTQTPHQWANQGCVVVNDQNHTLGPGINENGGAVYALEWDPANNRIASWVFLHRDGLPPNLQDSLLSYHHDPTTTTSSTIVSPDPSTWGLPYGYFAIGNGTGCSADHFVNMRIVLNTAFCGTVAGNRFFSDCPSHIATKFNASNDPVKSCNAYLASEPEELQQAYWDIAGVYVYQRSEE